MTAKKILVISLVIAFTAAVAGVLIANHKTSQNIALKQAIPPSTNPAPAISKSQPAVTISAIGTEPQIQSSQAEAPPAAKHKKIAAQNSLPAQPASTLNGKETIQDPEARAALSYVGADSDAEKYWVASIFDTSLPDQERADLMEDLNEDGLSDSKHPGSEDLPLILNRIALIEEIAPSADPFMQKHLGEAYKDLNNMLAGKPVQ